MLLFAQKMESTLSFANKCLIVLLVLPNIFSFNTPALSTHYIIAFDQSVGKYHADYLSPKTLSTLTSVLKNADFAPDKDYLSMVGYTMEMGDPSMDRFVRPYVNSEGAEILWLKISDANLSELFKKWPEGQPILNPYGAPYGSMQSFAKPYIVMEAHTNADSSLYADKTILLLVTDEKVNGTDDNYTHEWDNISTSLGANTQRFANLSRLVFKRMQLFNEEFKFLQIPIGQNRLSKIPLSSDGRYKVVSYEVIAVDKPSIHSVTDFPSPLPLQRVRGGFKLAVDTKSINDKYKIYQMTLYNRTGKLLGQVSDGNFDMIIPSNDIQAGDTIVVSLSLRMKDGFYGGALISSENPRYKNGMTSKQVVKIQDEAKVLGLLPLKDSFWWWFSYDVFTAVMIWDLVIILISIILLTVFVMWITKKMSTYVPSSHLITIRPTGKSE